MTESAFFEAEAVPDAHASDFLNTAPVFSQKLPGVTIKRLSKVLRAEPFVMQKCLRQDIKAYEMKSSRWQRGKSAPDTMIRSMRYKMPVPDDIPSAARSLVKVPEFCNCQTFCRLRCSNDELDLTFQTLSSGLPFGENLRLQVANTFLPYSKGKETGVTFQRWVVIVWVKELP